MEGKLQIKLTKQALSNSSNKYNILINNTAVAQLTKQQSLFETTLPNGSYTIEIKPDNNNLQSITQPITVNSNMQQLLVQPKINFAIVYGLFLLFLIVVYVLKLIFKYGKPKFPNFWLAMFPLVFILLNEDGKKKPNFTVTVSGR